MDVKKVATLAHLEITDEEVALYTPQMAEIVKYVEQLNELDTEDVEPMLGGLTTEGEATATAPARRTPARRRPATSHS
jgi:aspartyl-tRNA(Asn)/glutamyl-tRNA(Gln) amidotransferase subunit C